MRLAKHLAVLGRRLSALTPGGDVIGVHVVEFVDFRLHAVVPDRAERAV